MASTRTLFPDEGAAAAAAAAMSQLQLGSGALEGLDHISGGNNLNAYARTAQARGSHPSLICPIPPPQLLPSL